MDAGNVTVADDKAKPNGPRVPLYGIQARPACGWPLRVPTRAPGRR